MRLLTRVLFHGGRVSTAAAAALYSCAEATLTFADMRANIRTRWQRFNDREFDVDQGLLEWEFDVTDRLATPGASVLIAGCGSGRELFVYLARGCRVTGIDPAPQALGLARTLLDKRGLAAELIDGFIDDVEVPGRFDVVLFGWYCYSQIPEAARRIRTLQRVVTMLNPGGRICLNYDQMPRPNPLVISAARIAGALAGSDWRLEPGDVVDWRWRDGQPYFNFTHAFVPEEIERETAAAGLRIVHRRDPPDDPVYILEPDARS